MANENENVVIDEDTNEYQEYIDQINNLKKNTVSTDVYNKLKEENRALLNSIVNGNAQVATAETVEERESLEDLRERTFNNPFNDLEFVKGMLEIRKRVLENGGSDPFVAENPRFSPTEMDKAEAERTAAGYQHCIDVANGSNEIFAQELTRITKDTGNIYKTNKRR